jgi:hypothetical protein
MKIRAFFIVTTLDSAKQKGIKKKPFRMDHFIFLGERKKDALFVLKVFCPPA